MPRKRTPAEHVARFVGHVPDDSAEDTLATLDPITVQHPVPAKRMTLTPQVVEAMKMKVAGGNTIPVAASAMGIPHAVWSHWAPYAKRDQAAGLPAGWGQGESPYLVWAAAMVQAKAACEENLLSAILAHASDDWKAPAWVLERRFPNRWSVKKTVEHTLKKDDVTQLSTEQLIDLANKEDGE